MPTVLACLRRSVERMWPRRVPTRFGPATRLRRPKNQWNQGPLATQQAEMCPRTANSGLVLAARERCRGWRIEPPSPERLNRLVRSAVHRHDDAFGAALLARLPAETAARLDALLHAPAPDGAGRAPLLALRAGPGRASLQSVADEVSKL